MERETTDFDPAEYLENDEMIAGYLSDAMETRDSAFVVDAIRVAARAKGMRRDTGSRGDTRTF